MQAALLAQLSTIGLVIFAGLYLYASARYEGGNRVDAEHKKWDWFHNYWCDIIWPTTYTEAPNRASKWGITANFLLCISFILFFWAFAMVYAPTTLWTYLIGWAGTLAMLGTMLIFTELHDRIIGIIVISALPAVLGLVYGLVYFQERTAIYLGAVALLLVVANVYSFFTKQGEHYLPFMQKVAFVVVIAWAIYINSSIT